MKILITGNTGFVGKFLTKSLVDKGHQVIGLDVSIPEKKNDGFVLGSVLDIKSIMEAAKGADAIIHLAAKHHDFGISREEFFEVNVQGTQNLLDCASRLGIKKFIFYSTVAVYGNHKAYTNEDTTPEPESDYGESKLAAEKRVNKWVAEDKAREVIIIRPTVVFGPQNYANMYNLINSIYKKRFIFVGKGENIKSVAYVENLVEATTFLLEGSKAGLQVYSYSDYPQMSSGEIVETIAENLPGKMPQIKLPLRPTLALASVFDLLAKLTGYNFPITANRIKKFNTATHHKAEKIKEAGFRASVELKVGLKRMVDWYLSRNGRG